MLTPPEARARLYLPPGKGGERASEQYLLNLIEENHLAQPYLVQYVYWVKSLFTWGYSPSMRTEVLPALLHWTPATLELMVYSLLLFPLGLGSGLFSGWKSHNKFDTGFRALAFIGTSMPSFIVAMILISISFTLNWIGWLQVNWM